MSQQTRSATCCEIRGTVFHLEPDVFSLHYLRWLKAYCWFCLSSGQVFRASVGSRTSASCRLSYELRAEVNWTLPAFPHAHKAGRNACVLRDAVLRVESGHELRTLVITPESGFATQNPTWDSHSTNSQDRVACSHSHMLTVVAFAPPWRGE